MIVEKTLRWESVWCVKWIYIECSSYFGAKGGITDWEYVGTRAGKQNIVAMIEKVNSVRRNYGVNSRGTLIDL